MYYRVNTVYLKARDMIKCSWRNKMYFYRTYSLRPQKKECYFRILNLSIKDCHLRFSMQFSLSLSYPPLFSCFLSTLYFFTLLTSHARTPKTPLFQRTEYNKFPSVSQTPEFPPALHSKVTIVCHSTEPELRKSWSTRHGHKATSYWRTQDPSPGHSNRRGSLRISLEICNKNKFNQNCARDLC
jgi:hypothetical protein